MSVSISTEGDCVLLWIDGEATCLSEYEANDLVNALQAALFDMRWVK